MTCKLLIISIVLLIIVSWKLDAMESIVVKLDENKCNEYIEINSLEEAITTVKQYIMKNGKYDEKKFEKKIAKKQYVSPEGFLAISKNSDRNDSQFSLSLIKKIQNRQIKMPLRYNKHTSELLLDIYRNILNATPYRTGYNILQILEKEHEKTILAKKRLKQNMLLCFCFSFLGFIATFVINLHFYG